MFEMNTRGGLTKRLRTRLTVRTIIVLILALGMTVATVAAPSRAGEGGGGDDLESVRATVMEKYNYKVGLLTEEKADTDNPAKIDVYAAGIAELTTLRDTRVATEDNIDELWALKERAYAIYNETVNAAKTAGMTDAEILAAATKKATDTITYKIDLLKKWIKECEDANTGAIVDRGIAILKALYPEVEAADTADAAYAVKDRAYAIHHETIKKAEDAKAEGDCDGRSEEEKVAEALAEERRSTLTLIERKTAILTAAAEAAKIPAIVEAFERATDDVAGLESAARSATSIKALEDIRDQVMEIYEEAKEEAARIKGRDDPDGEEGDPGASINRYLDRTADFVGSVIDRTEWSAEHSPDTYDDLLEAKARVMNAIEAVQGVIESGRQMDDRWQDLNDALRAFRRAVIQHYVALATGPVYIGGFHIAG